MRLLVDSHTLIWAVDDPARLGIRAMNALNDLSHERRVPGADLVHAPDAGELRQADSGQGRSVSASGEELGMSTATQRVHRFTLPLSGIADRLSDAELDRLFEAGCDDALIGCTAGEWSAGFDRDAPSLAEAVLSAVRDVEAAGVEGLAVEGVKADEPDELAEADLAAIAYLDAMLRARRLASQVPRSGSWPAGCWPRPFENSFRLWCICHHDA